MSNIVAKQHSYGMKGGFWGGPETGLFMNAFFEYVCKSLLAILRFKMRILCACWFNETVPGLGPTAKFTINKMPQLAAAFLFAPYIQAASLTVIPNAQTGLVTAGIPFGACVLPDVSKLRLLNQSGAEVGIFIKPTLFWPASKCNGVPTIRAVKIQFAHNAAQGIETYYWQLAPRSLPDLAEAPIAEVQSGNPKRAPYKEPAFFAVNDPAYLVSTGLIPPTTIAGGNDYDRFWYPAAFNKRVNSIDFHNTIGENWLFDSVSSIYTQAIRSGNVEQYREAYLEHEFWISKMEVVVPADLGGFKLVSGDMKYMYLSPMKLHLALTGDDSWTPQENGSPHANAKDKATLIKTIGSRAMTVRGVGVPYNDVAGFFTERNSGFALQQMVAAYELTTDPAILANLVTAVNNLYNMMANNPDGIKNHGYLSHSWDAHEGSYYGYIGMTPVFDGPADSTQTTSELIIRNPIGDDYLKIAAGSTISFKPYGPRDAKLAERMTKNADGTLTMKLTGPAAIRSNQWAMFLSTGSKGTESLNLTADRIFSPWMQAIIADGLWQLYNLVDDAPMKGRIQEMLLGFGRAVTAYAVDGKGLAPSIKAQIESAFEVTVVNGPAGGSRDIVPYVRYVANAEMAGPHATTGYISYMNYDGGFSDQHSSEALFQISLAIKFETDPAKKAAMQSVASALTAWFAKANLNRTILSSHPARYFNWTNKQNAWGTYEAIQTGVDDSSSTKISDLVIAGNETLTNTALLINPVIDGAVSGGSLSGTVKNVTGTIRDVHLIQGTIVNGGTVNGRITGAGTIINAILDATEVDSGIWLGSGVKITARTLGNLTGTNLAGLVVRQDGQLDFLAVLLVDDSQNGLTMLDIMTSALNKHFSNNATFIKHDNQNGLVSFINNDFDDAYINLRPTSLKVANSPDSISMNHRGDLVISESGLTISFAAAPKDVNMFRNGLHAINAVDRHFGNGLIEADLAGARYVFRISQQSLQNGAQGSNSAVEALGTDSATVSFISEGSNASPQSHLIKAIYPDGSVQVLRPYVHDIEGFEEWMLTAGFTYSIDATEGLINVYRQNVLVWKGIPSYNVNAIQSQASVQILESDDVNKDGFADFRFGSPRGTQLLFGLPVN